MIRSKKVYNSFKASSLVKKNRNSNATINTDIHNINNLGLNTVPTKLGDLEKV